MILTPSSPLSKQFFSTTQKASSFQSSDALLKASGISLFQVLVRHEADLDCREAELLLSRNCARAKFDERMCITTLLGLRSYRLRVIDANAMM